MMSDRPDLARLATHLLARDADDARPEVTAARSREMAIAAIAQEMARVAATRRRTRIGLAFAAAAALLLGIVAVRARKEPVAIAPRPSLPLARAQTKVTSIEANGAVTLLRAGHALSPNEPARVGDRITTANDATAVLALSTGSKISVGAGGALDLALLGRQQVFGLASGNATFSVAKLASDERFLVRTSDAELEVRGTVFEVSLVEPDSTCAVATKTRLVVKEGLVVVHHHGVATSVGVGGVWPSGCAAKAAPALVPAKPSGAVASITATPASDLQQQNDTYLDAVAAKKSGASSKALAGFDRYLARWPNGPLAENATVERMRLLTGAQKIAAAKAYLARYPKGFAATEARAMVDTASP